MSNNIYSDQVNNSNLYANKLFYGEEGEQVENLGDQVAGEEDAVESQKEITKLEEEVDKLKKQVQEERR